MILSAFDLDFQQYLFTNEYSDCLIEMIIYYYLFFFLISQNYSKVYFHIYGEFIQRKRKLRLFFLEYSELIESSSYYYMLDSRKKKSIRDRRKSPKPTKKREASESFLLFA